jgi:hypothetical protein
MKDECSPPPAGQLVGVPSEWDQTVGDGAICLLGICRYAGLWYTITGLIGRWTNASLGKPCIHESTVSLFTP